MKRASRLEEIVANRLDRAKIRYVREHRFAPGRKYRADFSILDEDGEHTGVLVEVEGGIYSSRSGHRSVAGLIRDCRKYSLASSLGFLVIRVTPKCLKEDVPWIEQVKQAVERKRSMK